MLLESDKKKIITEPAEGTANISFKDFFFERRDDRIGKSLPDCSNSHHNFMPSSPMAAVLLRLLYMHLCRNLLALFFFTSKTLSRA